MLTSDDDETPLVIAELGQVQIRDVVPVWGFEPHHEDREGDDEREGPSRDG